jgi:general secretion pathway protein E
MLEKSLAELLVELKIISADTRRTYEQESTDAGMPIATFLRERNLVSDRDLARAYAAKFELPLFDQITEKMADPEVLVRVSLQFLRTAVAMPIIVDGKIMLCVADPFAYQPIDELRLIFGEKTPIAVVPRSVLTDAINRYYPLEGTKEMIEELEEEQALEGVVDFGEMQEDDIIGMGGSEAPIIRLVNHIFYQAVKRGASDIHIEPSEKEIRIRYRIDGVLYTVMTPPKRIQAALSSRIKIMANLNIAEKRQPQDGRIQIKIADKAIDVRVSVLPIVYGERISMRLLDKTRTFGALPQLGLCERDLHIISSAIHEPNGIILLTGPTGSGKTSTLYSILSELNTSEVNILTVEDPVEYQMKGIGQVQVKEQIGLTFAAALRSFLRQDPDIIMIGEMRDPETTQIAIQSALTGHLVLSTIHTNSAAATVTRLIDMGTEPYLIASSVSVVIAQRLVRKLCDVCKRSYHPPIEMLRQVGVSEAQAKGITFYDAIGCEVCLNLGYRGRLAIFEVMQMTPGIMRLTIERSEMTLIQRQAQQDGMTLLLEDGMRKVKAGLTTIEEVLSVATVHE